MLTLFWIVLWLALMVLMIVAALRVHLRRKELTASPLRVDDAAIHAILERGELTIEEDEPLDLTEIDASEERFWSESWDEPDEW